MDAKPLTPEEVNALAAQADSLLAAQHIPQIVKTDAAETLRWAVTVRAALAERDAYRAEVLAWRERDDSDLGSGRWANVGAIARDLRAANEARERQA